MPGHNEVLLGGQKVAGNVKPSGVPVKNNFGDSFDIIFSPGANADGMTIGCLALGFSCSENVTGQVFGAGGLISQTSLSGKSAFNTYLGIDSSVPILEISLQDGNPDTQSVQGMLNVWFGDRDFNIPMLSEWEMITAPRGD